MKSHYHQTSLLIAMTILGALWASGSVLAQAPTPIGPSAWQKADGRIQRAIGPMGSPVLNYPDTDSTWAPIDDDFVEVGDGWESVRGNHRVYASADGAAIYARGNHYLGTETTHLIKFNKADSTWEILRASEPDSITVSGRTITMHGIFPGIDKSLINNAKVLEAFSERYTFTQEARDLLETWTPWANRLLGTVTRLGVDSLRLSWRDVLGLFSPDTVGRMTDGWIDFGSADTTAFCIATSHLQTEDSITSIPVHKLIVRRAGQVFLVELFNPVRAASLPDGPLFHNAMVWFGHKDPEAGSLSIENVIRADEYTMGATAGTADSITVYMSGGGDGPNKKKFAIYDAGDNFVGGTIEEQPGTGGTDWHGIEISGTVNLNASTNYQLAAWANFVTSIKVAVGAGSPTTQKDVETYGSWPDPATFVNEAFTIDMSIYCTYTEEVEGGVSPRRRRLLLEANQ